MTSIRESGEFMQTTQEVSTSAESRAAGFCVFVVAIAFLGSIAGIHFVTLDDRWYAAWVWNHSWLTSAYDFAVGQGRLLKPSSYTYYFAYLFDSPVYQATLRLGTIVASVWLAGLLLQRVVRGHGTALLFALFFFAFAQNSVDHNLFTAYPFGWEFSWLCWMVGLLGLMVAIDRQSMGYALVGTSVLLIGLQEAFVPYTLILMVVASAASSERDRRWRYLTPYLAGLAIWLALWIAWRVAHPSGYEGSELALDSWSKVVRAIATYSVGGMPMMTAFYPLSDISWENLWGSISALSVIKAAAVFFAVRILSVSASRSPLFCRRGSVALTAATLLVMAFLPNVLIGMTPKYQEWVRVGVHAYLYSHFSYFAWIGLGTLGVLALVNRWRSRVLVGVLATTAAVASFVTDASNVNVNRLQEQFGRRWDTMETFLASDAFGSIPDGAAVWMADASVTGNERADAAYWQFVIRARTGKNLLLTPDPAIAAAALHGAWYLYLYDEPKTENQYVLISRLEHDSRSGAWISRSFSIYPNSPNNRFQVSGVLACVRIECLGAVKANGQATGELFDGAFSVEATTQIDKRGANAVQVDVAAGVDVRTLRVDFARNPIASAAPLAVTAAKGFRGWESDGSIRWNWGDVDAQLDVHSEVERAIPVSIEFWLVGGDARTITITDADKNVLARPIIDGNHPDMVHIPLTVSKGVTSILLHSEQPALYSQGGSGLAFQLRDLRLDIVAKP